jgi:formate hydrogenlyase subunit 3/multisubunit Na+/H+ antiporter MnhD subunit
MFVFLPLFDIALTATLLVILALCCCWQVMKYAKRVCCCLIYPCLWALLLVGLIAIFVDDDLLQQLQQRRSRVKFY